MAFGMPSTGEWVVLLVVGLLIFGRRLPEVGKSLAKTLAQFRRGLQDFKRDMDKDDDLKDIKKDIKSTVSDLKKTIDAPRIMANPGKYLDRLADEPEQAPAAEPEQAPVAEPEQAPVVEPEQKELPAQGVGAEEEGKKEEEKA
jgi:TatA/E family protein of Tat protein translocase